MRLAGCPKVPSTHPPLLLSTFSHGRALSQLELRERGLDGNLAMIDLDAGGEGLLSGDEDGSDRPGADLAISPEAPRGSRPGSSPGPGSELLKIKVVVRKRPLNGKERDRGEEDIIECDMRSSQLVLNEPKVKVDLTRYTERHEFSFDEVLDETVTNDQVYGRTVRPLVETIFHRGKCTCFAYGQTGSGKTYTMQPLPIQAARDILSIKRRAEFQDLELWVSYFEIYGGKVFDLLNGRQRLVMREDGKKNVCVVGLAEHCVGDDVDLVTQLLEHGNAARSTGSTGANADSSRSHAIMQFSLKKPRCAWAAASCSPRLVHC